MQTSWIAASLLGAFFVFITVRGELPEYIAVFTGTDTGPARVYDASGRVVPPGSPLPDHVYDESGKEVY